MTHGPSTTQVVHLDFIALADGVTDAATDDLIASAASLATLPSVATAGVIRASRESNSDFDLAFFFVLDHFGSLEPFGTDPRYIRFLQGQVARVLRGFAGADIALRAAFPTFGRHARCLALAAPEETYDWEVWSALEEWSSGTNAAIGLAIGERQRYRGCVIAFTSSPTTVQPDDRFAPSLISGAIERL